MRSYFDVLRPFLFRFSPETAHHLALLALRLRVLPRVALAQHPALVQRFWGQVFAHPLGLAAGFDKNAEALHGLKDQGFAFIEAGTVTPRPQMGNPKPRLFRLADDAAIINRMGFNNAGIDAFLAHFSRRPRHPVIGANIGKNKETLDPIADYVALLERVFVHADYVTINISSPNTPGLRALQEKEAVSALVCALVERRVALEAQYGRRVPLWLKIAPDLTLGQEEVIADVAITHGLEALVIGNTTIARPMLQSVHSGEIGGLSGKPLFLPSTEQLARFYRLTKGTNLVLVGVGGVDSAEAAYRKLKAGASLVGVYSALVYQGFGLVPDIVEGLAYLLARDGVAHVSSVVGVESA